jgi:hypothetical protein
VYSVRVNDRIVNIRHKLQRARKHLHDLHAAVEAFRESKPYKICAKPHPVKQIRHTVLCVESVQPLPPEIPLIIGDAVHNMRSCLDHLAWQLVLANGNTPDRATYFPILDPAKDPSPKVKAETGKGMSDDARDLIWQLQPRVSGLNKLWQLHQLDIFDKHRLVIAATLANAGWEVKAAAGGSIEFPTSYTFPLRAGYEITNLPTSTYERQKIDDFKLIIEVKFDEPQANSLESVLTTLDDMAIFIDALLLKFEALLD